MSFRVRPMSQSTSRDPVGVAVNRHPDQPGSGEQSRSWIPLAAVLAALLLLAAACSGSGSGDSSASDFEAASATTVPSPPAAGDAGSAESFASESAQTTVPSGGAVPAADGTEGEVGAIPAALQPADIGRDIIYTAEVSIQVDDVDGAAQSAMREMAALGGLLFGQRSTTEPEVITVLTFKVRPEDFSEALTRLDGVGEVVSQSVSTDDVTERVVDLESRILTAERSVERLRNLLDSAGNLDEISRLEAQLLERETLLEQLKGQLRTIQAQVSLATIVLTITPRIPPIPEAELRFDVSAYGGHDSGENCPGTSSLTLDEGADMTVCYVITNTGEAPVTDFEIVSSSLEVVTSDLIAVEGDPEQPLAPGARLVLAQETILQRDLTAHPAVFALADVSGPGVDRPAVEIQQGSTRPLTLDAVPDDSLPGFGDALGSSLEVLATLAGLLVVALGWVVPFLWILPIVVAVIWWRRRHRRRASDMNGDSVSVMNEADSSTGSDPGPTAD
ncbi:MAG TPA: DUF4349 domain-containing protein [Acidimicrobiales bacterium]|nr:DUF4349 domain-containing protein [Acidimicrobiales bacterium]